jgi:hypothetical protein
MVVVVFVGYLNEKSLEEEEKEIQKQKQQREGKRFVGAAAGKKYGEIGLFLGFYV